MFIFLTVVNFFFMATKTALVDTSLRISEIVEVRSDVLVDLLVVLARVFDAVAPSSPLETLSIVAVLVGEMTLAGAAIKSWCGRSANQAHRVGRSLILADLVDLAVRCFKHGSDLGDLWCLLEPGELISGHCQIGAWGLVDVVAVNADKLIVEVALEWPSL